MTRPSRLFTRNVDTVAEILPVFLEEADLLLLGCNQIKSVVAVMMSGQKLMKSTLQRLVVVFQPALVSKSKVGQRGVTMIFQQLHFG